MKINIKLILSIVILLPINSLAGWIITGRYIDREGNTYFKRYFIQNNQVKVERYNLIYTCNLKTETIILIDPENLVYTETSLNAYTEKLKDVQISRLKELLELIPEDQKSEYERLYRLQSERNLILSEMNSDSLFFKKMPDTVKLLGYQTSKYILTHLGRKKEELFLTNEVDISSDINMKVFLQYAYLLEPEDKTISYRSSEKYSELVKNGMVLRRFIFEEGNKTEWQVNNIEEKNIPFYEFGKPDLCKEITLDQWLLRQKDVEGKQYDDYE
jgi:hypothetical protein